MDDNRSTWIEFTGGPIDGYALHFAVPLRNLAIVRIAAHYRLAGHFRIWVRRLLPWKVTDLNVLGVYLLIQRESKFRYHYVQSFSSTDTQFDEECVESIRRNTDGSLWVPRQVELAAALQRSISLPE